jgi:nickel/cobalt exporter
MTSFSTLLAQGTANAWLFIPSAILLGSLHGLEPGHSKTMMAAFIVAIRGTVGQAVLLGLSATLSHTAVVWVIALGGMYFGQKWDAETSEPYLQVASAVLIVGVAVWMMWRTWRQQQFAEQGHDHDHEHHHDDTKRIDTGHGVVRLGSVRGRCAAAFPLVSGKRARPHLDSRSGEDRDRAARR